MTPASQRYQTTMSASGSALQYGDCLAACVASVLDCDISECDDLHLKPDMKTAEFWNNLASWSHQRGIIWLEFSGRDTQEIKDLPNVIAIGRPRAKMPSGIEGVEHAVVYSRGRQVWDPNPGKIGVGLVSWFLVPTISSAIKFMTWRFPNMQYRRISDLMPEGQRVPTVLEAAKIVKTQDAEFRSEVNDWLDDEHPFNKKEWDGQEVTRATEEDIYWKPNRWSEVKRDTPLAQKVKPMTQEEVDILAAQFSGHDRRHRSYKKD